MADQIWMTCYNGPLDGSRYLAQPNATEIKLKVPIVPPLVSEGSEGSLAPSEPKEARYRISELIGTPGVPVLIYVDDEE